MKKFLKWLIAILLVLVVVFLVGRNAIIKAAMIQGVRGATGMEVSIGSLDVELAATTLEIKDLAVQNPPGFGGGAMLVVPEVKVDYVLKSFFQGKAFFTELVLHVKNISLVKDKAGKLNVEVFRAPEKEEKPEPGRPGEKKPEGEKRKKEEKAPAKFRVDVLKLRIDRASFTDLETGEKDEYDLQINEEFKNVTDQADVMRIVIVAALRNNLFRRATHLDLNNFSRDLGSRDLKKAGEGLLEGILGK